MNKYTFHINTERISPPWEIVNVNATTQSRAWKQIESAFPLKGITLAAINDVPYIEEDDDSYCPPTAEDRYWAAAATYAERHSVTDTDEW